MSKNNNWPSVRVSPEMRSQISRIISFEGYLRGIDQKDLLVIAASIALNDTSTNIKEVKKSEDVIHQSNLRVEESKRYRAFICMLNFSVGGGDLTDMTDKSKLVNTFVEYAAAGLNVLEANYLQRNKGNAIILEAFQKLEE